MLKRLLASIQLCCAVAPATAAQLSTYPTLSLAKVAGVDSGGNVGLMTPQAILNLLAGQSTGAPTSCVGISGGSVVLGPCGFPASTPTAPLSSVAGFEADGITQALSAVAALPCAANVPNAALYYKPIAGVIGCSSGISINDTGLTALNRITLPDGGSFTPFFNTFGAEVTIAMNGGINFGNFPTTPFNVFNTSPGTSAQPNTATFACPNISSGQTCTLGLGIANNITSGTGVNLAFTWEGTEFNSFACLQFGNTTCQQTFGASGSLSLRGALSATAMVANAAAGTVGAGQIAYGGTVTANTNCGGVGTGCVLLNIAGTARYVSYY